MIVDARHGTAVLNRLARTEPVDRPADRGAGLAPAGVRSRRRHRAAPRDLARRPRHQVPGLLPSGRSDRAAAGAGTPAGRAEHECAHARSASCCSRSSAPSAGPPVDDDTVPRAIQALLQPRRAAGLVEARAADARPPGARSRDVIAERDPQCNGVLLLGLDAPEATLRSAFEDAAGIRPVPRLRGRPQHLRPAARAWFMAAYPTSARSPTSPSVTAA